MPQSTLERVTAWLKGLAGDILGEEPEPQGRAPLPGAEAAGLAGLLEQAQGRLDALRLELAEASARQKRIAQASVEAQQRVEMLDLAVDDTLRAGKDDLARTRLAQAQQAKANAAELHELQQTSQQLVEHIQQAVRSQQEKLALLRSRYLALVDREQTANALDELMRAEKELSQQQSTLQTEFEQREAQIARREDHLAARRDWNHGGKENL